MNEHFENVEPLINAINVGVKRTADIVSSLNYYSHQDKIPDIDSDINQIIDKSLLILKNRLDNNSIEIRKNFTDAQYIFKGNENKLQQAFMNIILNSVQAIENNGVISITTSVSQGKLSVVIEDNGCGISEVNLPKLFDPFFTTKDPGKGIGLGLSLTYEIIKEHKGNIEYESKEGKGTIAKITLLINNI